MWRYESYSFRRSHRDLSRLLQDPSDVGGLELCRRHHANLAVEAAVVEEVSGMPADGVLDLSVAASIRIDGHVIAVVCSTQSIVELKDNDSRRLYR